MEHKRFDAVNKIYFRPGTDDQRMIKEVITNNAYKALNLKSSDVVLDLGANIGTFAKKYCLEVKQIISLEPFTDNIKLFKENVGHARNVLLIEKAVSESAKKCISFFVSKNKKYAGCSLKHKMGYEELEVQTISLKKLINTYKPTKIKCDIEFEEFNLDWSVLKNSKVDTIMMEIHNGVKHRDKMIPLINKIKRLGFKSNFNRDKITGNFCIVVRFFRDVKNGKSK